MRSKDSASSHLIVLLGLIQIALALCGVVYALYPTGSERQEKKELDRILEEIRENNRRPETQPPEVGQSVRIPLYLASQVSFNSRAEVKRIFFVRTSSPAIPDDMQSKSKQKEPPPEVLTLPRRVKVKIRRPSQPIRIGRPVEFAARVDQASSCKPLKYNWEIVGDATITAGHGTPRIKVVPSGEKFTVLVEAISDDCAGNEEFFVNITPGSSTIEGFVYDEAGAPLAGIQINVGRPKPSLTGDLPLTKTDSKGFYRIERLTGGSYSISIDAPGYQRYYKNSVIIYSSNDSRRLPDIVLQRKPTPTPTPTPVPTPTPTITPTPPIEPKPSAQIGEITVKWPDKLDKGWRDTIEVVYTPPVQGSPDVLAEGYLTMAAFKLVDLKGLKNLSYGELDFKPLDNLRQQWSLKIEPEDDAGTVGECTLAVEIKSRHRLNGKEISYDRPEARVQKISFSIGNPFISMNETYTGSGLFAISGSVFVGYGRKKRETHPRVEPAEKEKAVCHFSAAMDEVVALGRATTVEVTVSREVIEAALNELRATGTSEVDPFQDLVIQIVPKANFEIIDKDRVIIQPPQDNNPVKVLFDVRPTHLGEGEIWLIAQQGQVGLVTLRLKPQIVETRKATAPRTSAQAAFQEPTRLAEPLHRLSIIETLRGTEVSFIFLLESPALNIIATYWSEPIKGNLEQYVNNLYKGIEARWESYSDQADLFAKELRAFGGVLFDELVPKELQRVLWDRRKEIKSIMVISTEPFIPWELVHLKSPSESALPKEDWFLAQMGLVRWLEGRVGWPPEQLHLRTGRARYVIPNYPVEDYKLPEATAEAEFLRKKFDAQEVDAQPDPVLALISKPGQFDLLHFACHGVAEHNNIANGHLLLQGQVVEGKYVEASLSSSLVEQYSDLNDAKNRPMVVLNACQVGRAGYKISGIGGFARAFLNAGAGAFVGTLWSVGDSPARVFTETLYKELLKGSSLSQATIKARAQARKKGVATWLAYVVYGHPHMRIGK